MQSEAQKGDTVLHIAAANGLHSMARLLLSLGADVGLQNDEGLTPLHVVSQIDGTWGIPGERFACIVNALVAAGADVNARSRSGATPLMIACSYESSFALKQLLKNP